MVCLPEPFPSLHRICCTYEHLEISYSKVFDFSLPKLRKKASSPTNILPRDVFPSQRQEQSQIRPSPSLNLWTRRMRFDCILRLFPLPSPRPTQPDQQSRVRHFSGRLIITKAVPSPPRNAKTSNSLVYYLPTCRLWRSRSKERTGSIAALRMHWRKIRL